MSPDDSPRVAVRPEPARGVCALLLAASLLPLTGCPPMGRPPASRQEAMDRVNVELGVLNETVDCAGLVSFEFRDAEGRWRRFLLHDARFFFLTPARLLFEVRALPGTVAEFGSNDKIYWLWLDVPDVRRLWYGAWARAARTGAKQLPIPPGELLDALMLRPLPERSESGLAPLLRVEGSDHRLLYLRTDSDGQPAGWREVRLDPRPPHMPVEVVDRDADGRVLMHAQLSDYRRIGRDGPYTPRRYIVYWPDGSELRALMRLDVLRARLRPDLDAETFEFNPADWRGETIQLDLLEEGTVSE